MMKRPSFDVSSGFGFAGSGGAMSMRRSNPHLRSDFPLSAARK
jgi:hypothetical protein